MKNSLKINQSEDISVRSNLNINNVLNGNLKQDYQKYFENSITFELNNTVITHFQGDLSDISVFMPFKFYYLSFCLFVDKMIKINFVI